MKFKNTKKQGDWGLGVAIGWFCENGLTVSIPLTDSQDYDLVVESLDGLERVQVKTSMHRTSYGVYQIQLSTKGGNRSWDGTVKKLSSDIESVFCVLGNGECYWIPRTLLGGVSVNPQNKYPAFRVK